MDSDITQTHRINAGFGRHVLPISIFVSFFFSVKNIANELSNIYILKSKDKRVHSTAALPAPVPKNDISGRSKRIRPIFYLYVYFDLLDLSALDFDLSNLPSMMETGSLGLSVITRQFSRYNFLHSNLQNFKYFRIIHSFTSFTIKSAFR